MERLLALVATLAVGGLVAFQPPINALLSRHVGDLGAAFTSLLVSTLIVGVLLVAAGDTGQLAGLSEYRPVHLIAGVAGAAIVLVTLITVRSLGAGGVAAALISTQLITSALLDRAGAYGLHESPITASRVLGMAFLIVGTLLVTSR